MTRAPMLVLAALLAAVVASPAPSAAQSAPRTGSTGTRIVPPSPYGDGGEGGGDVGRVTPDDTVKVTLDGGHPFNRDQVDLNTAAYNLKVLAAKAVPFHKCPLGTVAIRAPQVEGVHDDRGNVAVIYFRAAPVGAGCNGDILYGELRAVRLTDNDWFLPALRVRLAKRK